MKKSFLLLLIFFVFSINLFAQPSKADILKFKIKKVTVNSAGGARGEGKDEYYYDEKGNDTALYADGAMSYRKKYETNKGRIVKCTQYGPEGELETAVYTYHSDSSYTVETKDKMFGLTDKEMYDKKGNILKKIIPDGSQYIYSYDAKGRLTKGSSKPGNGGVKATTIYTYNTKGQLVVVKNSGEYPWSEQNFYDAKGLLVKSLHTSSFEGQKEVTTNNYSYEFQ